MHDILPTFMRFSLFVRLRICFCVHSLALALGISLLGSAPVLAAIEPGAALQLAKNTKTRKPPARRVVDAMTPENAFKAAHAASRRNDQAGLERLLPALGDYPLRFYVDYWILRTQLRDPANDALPESLDREVTRFLQTHAKAGLVPDLLRRDWMLALGRRGQWAAFDREYARWVLRDDGAVQCYAALSDLQRGKPLAEDMRNAFRQAGDFNEACNALADQAIKNGQLSSQETWWRLAMAVESNALGAARKLAANYPDDEARKLEAALTKPAAVLTDPALSASRDLTVLALLRLARIDPERAADALNNLPTARRVSLSAADQALAWAHISAAAARRVMTEAGPWAARAKGAKTADETLRWVTRAGLRALDWPTVLSSIDAMTPDARSDSAWAYWRARALIETGRKDEGTLALQSLAQLSATKETGFYQQLASEELGQAWALPARTTGPVAMDETVRTITQSDAVARARLFYGLGLRFEGNREWNFALRGLNDRQLLSLADWAWAQGLYDRTISTSERAATDFDAMQRFPRPFKEPLVAAANAQGLDPALVYGLIRQESRFNADVISSAGAMGLMQLMPGTASWIARKQEQAGFTVAQALEVPLNLQMGSYYLKTVLEGLDGSLPMAAAGYNAGPNRPRQWRATLAQPVEGAIFAETIPFTETRDYVKKVLSNAGYYSVLLGGTQRLLKPMLGIIAPKTAVPSETP